MHSHHDHGHSHENMLPRERRGLWIALVITAGYFVAELVGGILTNSLALLADAGHMVTDVAALSLSLFAFWMAARPATPERTYGYHRVEVLAALANAVALVLVSLVVIFEAYRRINQPPEVDALPMFLVALGGVLANGANVWVLREEREHNLNVRSAFLHVLSDMVGSAGAAVAGIVMLTTGFFLADPIVSIFIALLIIRSAWSLLWESVDVLLEATPKHIPLSELQIALTNLPGVGSIHDLHVWTVTSGFLAMSVHVALSQPHRHQETLEAANEMLRERFGITHATLQMEEPGTEEAIHHGCYVGSDPSACQMLRKGQGGREGQGSSGKGQERKFNPRLGP